MKTNRIKRRQSRKNDVHPRRAMAAGGMLAGIGAAVSALLVRRHRNGARTRRKS